MSVTKFFTAMAAAYLMKEGNIESLDDPVSDWYPEWDDGERSGVTLRHLLTHTSGIEYRQSAMLLNQQPDKVAFVRQSKMEVPPGTRCLYSNEGVALLGGILEDAAGRALDQYLQKRLFQPLGIKDQAWDHDEAGTAIAYAQLQMTARDVAKVGQMLVNGGRYGKKQVFPEEWITTMSTPGRNSPGRGLLWLLVREPGSDEVVGFGHTGWLGQFLYVFPSRGLVGVRLRHGKTQWENDHTPYSFGEFQELCLALVPR